MSTNFSEFYFLDIHQPYDFETVLAFLRRHASFGIEEVSASKYTRYLAKDSKFELELANESQLKLSINSFNNHEAILGKVKLLFDTEHNPATLPKKTGVRVIASYDPFETSVSIILGQLISIKQATKKLEQLIKLYGKQVDEQIFIFPSAKDLQDKEIEEIGISKTKAHAIRALAKIIFRKELVFSQIADIKATERKLLSIKGIGPWTSQIILMRCFSYKDAFPTNDLFIKKALETGSVDEQLWQGKHAYLTHYLWQQATKDFNNY